MPSTAATKMSEESGQRAETAEREREKQGDRECVDGQAVRQACHHVNSKTFRDRTTTTVYHFPDTMHSRVAPCVYTLTLKPHPTSEAIGPNFRTRAEFHEFQSNPEGEPKGRGNDSWMNFT